MSDIRMPVALLVDKLVAGGAEKHALTLANGFDRRRFAVSCFTLKPGGALEQQLDRGSLERIDCAHVQSRIDLKAVDRLVAMLEAQRCEALITTNPYASLYGWLAARRCRHRPAVVATFHSTNLPGVRYQLEMLLYRIVFPLCDALVFVSDNQRRYWQRRGLWSRKAEVIHNGIDFAHFSAAALEPGRDELRARWGFPVDSLVVGICAALRPEKAIGDLLNAVSDLARNGIDARAAIIGDGPQRPEIERHVRALGIDARAVFTGFQHDVRPYVDACDVMALTSSSETFSLSALESMARGKPMVMTDVGGADEQVESGKQGYLYRPGDVAGLVDALKRLVPVDERRRLGDAARERVRKSFPLEAMLERYSQLLLRYAQVPADGINARA